LGGAAINLARQPDWRRLAVEPILLVRQGAPRLLGAPEMVLCRVIGSPLGKLGAGHRILQQVLRLLHGKSSSEHDPEKTYRGGMACRMAIQRYFRDHFAMLMNACSSKCGAKSHQIRCAERSAENGDHLFAHVDAAICFVVRIHDECGSALMVNPATS
jgi:hypothetical protein